MKNTRGVPLAADLKRQMQRTAVAAELPEVLLHSARVRRKALIHVPTPLLDGTGHGTVRRSLGRESARPNRTR